LISAKLKLSYLAFALMAILIFTGCGGTASAELNNNCIEPRRGIISPLADEIGLTLELTLEPPCFCRWNMPDYATLTVRNITDFPFAHGPPNLRIEYFDGDTWIEPEHDEFVRDDGVFRDNLGWPFSSSPDGRELYPILRMRPPQADATEFAPGRYRVVFSLLYIVYRAH